MDWKNYKNSIFIGVYIILIHTVLNRFNYPFVIGATLIFSSNFNYAPSTFKIKFSKFILFILGMLDVFKIVQIGIYDFIPEYNFYFVAILLLHRVVKFTLTPLTVGILLLYFVIGCRFYLY
eukprot:NODE_498_length_7675_cov_0.481389.p7 type:complete len:121 gc:universal NODE_498_length_7675_cov_0.481389:1769-2131(+)